MRFVNLTNHIQKQNTHIEVDEIEAKKLNSQPSYKLENAKGLIWASPERNDEFYSEWESVQPHLAQYAIYYEISKDSQVIKPKELFGIRNQMEHDLNENQEKEVSIENQSKIDNLKIQEYDGEDR